MQIALETSFFLMGSEISSCGEMDCFAPENGAAQQEAFEFELKIEIHQFFPPPMRAKEFQKLDCKSSLLVKDPTKEGASDKLVQKATRTSQIFTKVLISSESSSRPLFFPREKNAFQGNQKTGQNLSNSSTTKPTPAQAFHQALQGQKVAAHSSSSNPKVHKADTQLSEPSKHSETKSDNRSAVFSSMEPQKVHKEVHQPVLQKKQEQEDKEKQQERHSFQQEFENDEETLQKDKGRRLKGIEGVNASFSDSQDAAAALGKEAGHGPRKPFLEPPKIGVFALYYILDKMGIYSESTSYYQYKQEVETNEKDRTAAHQQMMSEMQKALDKEKQSARWGVALKVFSWMTSMTSILSGAVMIATGVGAVAGAILLVGGVISITNQIMEMTRGWEKVAEILPGDDMEKKRALVTWMQLGIAVLCLILAGAGVVFGGFGAVQGALSAASNFISGVAMVATGAITIGKGVEDYHYKYRLSDAKKHEINLVRLKHQRHDLIEKMEDSPDRLLNYYESLARNLGFLEEMNRAYQRAWS